MKKPTMFVVKTLQEGAYIAFFDPCCLFNEDGSLKGPHELTPEEAAAIACHEVKERPQRNQDDEAPGAGRRLFLLAR